MQLFDSSLEGPAGRPTRGRDRRHDGPPRRRRVSLRLSEAEFTAVAQAAEAERLTPSGYVAQVLQDSHAGAAVSEEEPLRRLLAGLVEATVAVACLARSVGDQDGPPDGLEAVLDRLDEATLAVLDELRWPPSRAGGRR